MLAHSIHTHLRSVSSLPHANIIIKEAMTCIYAGASLTCTIINSRPRPGPKPCCFECRGRRNLLRAINLSPYPQGRRRACHQVSPIAFDQGIQVDALLRIYAQNNYAFDRDVCSCTCTHLISLGTSNVKLQPNFLIVQYTSN